MAGNIVNSTGTGAGMLMGVTLGIAKVVAMGGKHAKAAKTVGK